MSTLKSFFKDTIIYGIASVLPRVITVLLTNIKTGVFKTETFAVDTTYFVYAAFFNIVLTYGLETAFFRFFTKEKEKSKVISTSFISILITTLTFLIIGAVYYKELSAFFGFSNSLFFILLLLTLVFDTLMVIPFAYLRVNNRPIRFAFYKISNVIINAFLVILVLKTLPNNNLKLPTFITDIFGENPAVIYVFLAGAIASFCTFIMIMPMVLKFKFTFDKDILKRMLTYSFPIMIAGLAYITNEQFDKLYMPKILGDSTMGIYAACYKLGVFMTLFITAFRLGAEPFFFNQANKNNAKEKYATILTWFTILGSVFMFTIVGYIHLFSKILISNNDYLEALKIVPIILLANLFLGIYHNLSIWYKLTDKTKYGMYISVFGAIITIIINVIGIPKYGYMASAYATLIAYGSMMLLSYFMGKKHYPVPYQITKVSLYLGLGIVFSLISYLKFEKNYIVSTLLLFTFIGIIFVNERKELKTIFKK